MLIWVLFVWKLKFLEHRNKEDIRDKLKGETFLELFNCSFFETWKYVPLTYTAYRGNIWYMMYFVTEIVLPPCGSSTVHIYTKQYTKDHRHKQYIEQHKQIHKTQKFWE